MLGNGCNIWNKQIFGSPEKDWLLVLKSARLPLPHY